MFRYNAMAVVLVAALLLCPLVVSAEHFVGIGRADVTGPAADVNLMGYAVLNQTAKGIHTRQYARAYVFADAAMQ
jgi:neutral ceramidase